MKPTLVHVLPLGFTFLMCTTSWKQITLKEVDVNPNEQYKISSSLLGFEKGNQTMVLVLDKLKICLFKNSTSRTFHARKLTFQVKIAQKFLSAYYLSLQI